MPDLKAAQRLITDGAITKVENAHVYFVKSQSRPGVTYTVILGENIEPSCDCPAYTHCKHILSCVTFDKPAVAEHYRKMAEQAAKEANHAA